MSSCNNAALNQVYIRSRLSDISYIKSSCMSKLVFVEFLTDDVDIVQYIQHCYYSSMMFTYLHKYKNYIWANDIPFCEGCRLIVEPESYTLIQLI